MTTTSSSSGKTPTRRRTEIDVLWDVLPHPPGSVVRLFAKRLSDGAKEGDFARSAGEIKNFARHYGALGYNIYVAPNPTNSTGGMRHSAKDVTHWSYFLIDADPIEGAVARPEAAIREALLWLGEWNGRNLLGAHGQGMTPIIIDSGRGCQAWVRLEDVLLNDVFRSEVRRINGWWLKRITEKLGDQFGCVMDTSVSDLPRVMRCPGTVNVRTGRRAKFLNATDHVFRGLAKLLTFVPKEVLVDPPPPQGVAPGARWQEVFVHMTAMAQNYLTRGAESGGRHKLMWHTAKKFVELGVSRREARRALRWANGLRGREEALEPEEIEHALDTAYGL